VKKKNAITNEIVFPISGSYVYCTTSYILLYYNYYYAHILWHIYVYYLITTMTTNVLVCFYNFFSCIHTRRSINLRCSWTRRSSCTQICVHILYIMRTWRVYTFYILLFNIDIKYIYCKKTIFIIFMSTFFTVIYLHVINVFYYYF